MYIKALIKGFIFELKNKAYINNLDLFNFKWIIINIWIFSKKLINSDLNKFLVFFFICA